MANFHHNNRNHGYRGRSRKNHNVEKDENKERSENKERHDQQEARALYRERRERENRERDNREARENREVRENKERRDRRENRENHEVRENREPRNNRDSRDNQAITTFTLGEKELEGKNAQFQYDKGWYSITDIIDEEKNVVYKSKNAQEAYTKWNVYIGRKKERPQRTEKVEN